MIENVDIYSLLPEQLRELIYKIENALIVVNKRKNTMAKVVQNEKIQIVCPYCWEHSIVKNGHTKTGIQTYKCKNCNKRFNSLTKTIFSKSRLNISQIETFYECMNNKKTIRETAKLMGVSTCTVFTLRHKVLDVLSKIEENKILSGEIEGDEYYISVNLKGTKPKNMPRFSKPRTTHGGSKRGISSHQVCIVSAIDENDNFFFEIAGTGPITSEMIRKSFNSKITNVKKLITDCKSSYESVAIENNWNLIQIKSGTYIDEYGNNLANINSLHSGLSIFLSRFRGVSTKHLQHYLNWYSFEKYLKYVVELTKYVSTFMKNTIINNTELNYKTVYNNSSGIDFNAVYSDYNYIPSRVN